MNLSRRELLESLGVAAAGAVTAGYTATAKGYAANEEITVGCIGTGGRCRRLMQSLATIPGVKIVAVCDIWDFHLAEGAKLAQPGAFTTKDYRAILGRKDIDAVVIGTPDHWHVPLTVEACATGKDVYVEKPLTHDLAEGQRVIDAQNQSKRIVQVGCVREVGPARRDPQSPPLMEPQHAPLGAAELEHRRQDRRLEAVSGHGEGAAVR